MSRILVIADDFTGAAEIGGIAYLYGLSVGLVTTLSVHGIRDKDVIVLDTNTRGLDPESASAKILNTLASMDLNEFKLVYKKVDSVLRGPIETEIKTIMPLCQADFTVLIPANPSKGRVIKNGRYVIDGVPISETDFVHDPEYPRCHDEVEYLIQDATEVQPLRSFKTDHVQKQIVVPDVYAPEHLSQIISDLDKEKFLPAGGADFFKALLEEKIGLRRTRDYSLPKLKRRILYITGSLHAQSRETLNILKKLGFTFYYVPEQAVGQDKYYRQWHEKIRMSIRMVDKIIIARPENKISDGSGIRKITSLISDVVLQMIMDCDPEDEVFIEGGETASTVFRNLGNIMLEIKQVLTDGVVTLGLRQPDVSITVKPGSYRWPEGIFTNWGK